MACARCYSGVVTRATAVRRMMPGTAAPSSYHLALPITSPGVAAATAARVCAGWSPCRAVASSTAFDTHGGGGGGGGAGAPVVWPAGPRPAVSLAHLTPAPGSNTPHRRKGRGEGSGMGKYATRGMKGAKSRAGGGVRLGFEGGQSPLWRRTPKIGYMPAMLDTPCEAVNLDTLQRWIDTGRVDITTPITMKALVDAGVVSSVAHGIKLLGRGADRFSAKVEIEVSQASESAIAAVEAAGGRIKTVYHTPLSLRALLQPHKFPLPVKVPRPHGRALEYYTAYRHRGYLNPEVQLAEVKQRLAGGMDPAQAAAVIPARVPGTGGAATNPGVAGTQ